MEAQQQRPVPQRPAPPYDVTLRTRLFRAPLPGFNPLEHQDELERYGLPKLPDRNTMPGAFEFWHTFYSPPLDWLQEEPFALVAELRLRSAFERQTGTATLHESSRNWSGLYITPRDGRMMTEVYGTWNVPEIHLPVHFADPERVRSSTWIGLDGQRSYYHSSLPQIGTEQFFKNIGGVPTAVYRAFYEWWARDRPSKYKSTPLALPINAKDQIMASITVCSAHRVRLYIKNQSLGGIHRVLEVVPPPDLTYPKPVKLKVSGATAEWIMERPTLPSQHIPDTLPDYEPITFTSCGAVSALGPGQPGRDETLIGARRITMQRVDVAPSRTVTISQPNSIVAPNGEQSTHSFHTTYKP